jgi:8-amino-7-oxononanoate synthase
MFFEKLNQQLREEGLFREFRRIDSPQGPRIIHKNREYILLASNDYLGLANHPRVIEAVREAAQRFGVGAGASRLLSGNMSLHERLEEAIAWLKGTETSLLFNTGYTANVGLLPALAGKGDAIFMDRLCHASLFDGALLSGARIYRYRHNDLNHLEKLLEKPGAHRNRWIVTEGIFSMEGDLAPLPDILSLADRAGARTFLDDAHATGVIGARGGGTLQHFGLESSRVTVLMGTLGKALGTFGAFVAGGLDLKNYLINTVRSLIYTTALPPPLAAASFTAIKVLQECPVLINDLWRNRDVMFQGLNEMGLDTLGSRSPIIPVLLGSHETATRFSQRLLEEGIFAPAIRPPTVPKGTSRIRVTVTAAHSREDLETSLSAFQKIGRELRVI